MTTKDAPAFDFYPERWLVGVASMSDIEQIAYLRLLCHQWLAGDDGLSNDSAALKRLAGKGCTPAVLAKFPVCEDGARRNDRLEVIRTEQRQRIAKKSEQRKAAAMRRWHPETCESNATASPAHIRETSGSNAHHPPPTTHPISNRESSAGAWPSLDEVKAYAPTVMASPECAEHFWNASEAAGWVNKHGQPIADWKPLFRNFATAWKSNEHRHANANTHRPTPQRSDKANKPGRYANPPGS